MTAGADRDVAIVGGGHNALVAATLLARQGLSVILFERSERVGGAAISSRPFEGVDVAISPYAYLVSLFPRDLIEALGIEVELRRRHPDSCTPEGENAVVIDDRDDAATRRSFDEMGIAGEHGPWVEWKRLVRAVASVVAPTLTEPLREAEYFRSRLGSEAWRLLVERPLGVSLQEAFASDLVRGIVLTDGLIGTFARSTESSLRQNRCYLYHVIGDGTGDWRVPVGGMGAVTDALAQAAARAGVEVHPSTEIVSLAADGQKAELGTATGERHRARVVLCGAAPSVLSRLLGSEDESGAVEGAQVKLNMVLAHLPRLRCRLDPEVAFAGTLHVNERASQLDQAWAQAEAGTLPSPVPCELYCHSLTDPSVIGRGLRHKNVHTLGLFALQTPGRLFGPGGPDTDQVLKACLDSFEEVLAEPLSDCLLFTPAGQPCVEIHTPDRLESDIALPGGGIFHGDLQWPWAEEVDEVGRWGVETAIPNVFICGSGARRGGAVSGIGGHNGAVAALRFLQGADR